jgi:hypothetical protein
MEQYYMQPEWQSILQEAQLDTLEKLLSHTGGEYTSFHMEQYYMQPEWQSILQEAQLDTLEKLLSYTGGECTSFHKRGTVHKITLPNQQILYLKRDNFTYTKDILCDLISFKKPRTKTEKEYINCSLLNKTGFIAPEIIACGQRRCLGWPKQGAILMLPIIGIDLETYIRQHKHEESTQKYIQQAIHLLQKLQNKGYYWPDNKPEHFFITEDNKMAVIDLERLRVQRKLSKRQIKKQNTRFQNDIQKIMNT